MKNWKKIFFVLPLLLISAAVLAQTPPEVKTSLMRRDGRIYVVVAVMLTILLGLILYLVRMERKLKKLENNQ